MKKILFSKQSIIISMTIYLMMICFFSILVISKNNYGVTQFGNRFFISASSNNKLYGYKEGDLIEIEKKNISELHDGDNVYIYKMQENEKKIDIINSQVQQVHAEYPNSYVILKNDNYRWEEKYIVGISRNIYPKMGYVMTALTSSWVFFILFFIPAVIIFIYEIYTLFNELKKLKKNNISIEKEDEKKEINQQENKILNNNTQPINQRFNIESQKLISEKENNIGDNIMDEPIIIIPNIKEKGDYITDENIEDELSTITISDELNKENESEPEEKTNNNKTDNEDSQEVNSDESSNNIKTENEPIVIGKGIKNFILKILELKKYEIFDILSIINNAKNQTFPQSVLKNIISTYVMDKYIQPIDYNEEDFKNKNKILIEKIEKYASKKRNLDSTQKKELTETLLFYNKLKEDYSNLNKEITSFITFESEDDKKIIVDCITEKGKSYIKLRKAFTERISASKMFQLIVSDTIIKKVYNTQLKSNIKFSKIFSEYVIDKSYSQSVVLENLEEVLLKLVGSMLIKELFNGDYEKQYIIHFNETLYKKERKINNFIDNFNDPFSQKKILILINADNIKKNKNILDKLKNQGFNFVIQLPKKDLMNVEFDRKILNIAEYIIIIGNLTEGEKKTLIPVSMIPKVYCINEAIDSEVIKA